MQVLLLSMPDTSEHMPALVVRMPNGALSSLAGNLDHHHRVAIADLVLAQAQVRAVVERLVRQLQPDVVGLSVMTFQRHTALKISALVRALCPAAKIVVGGYDPSLAPEAYGAADSGVDFIVRGEGELTFRELLRAIEAGQGYAQIAGLSYREAGRFVHNPDRLPQRVLGEAIAPPRRSARVLSGYTMLGRQVDVIETSRGCTFDCSFCSIIEMRGRNFNTFSIERVIADIRDARDHGARAIFIVDDNITLNVRRFSELCQAIIDAGLHTLDYSVQAMTSAIANHGADLAPLMRKAGFRYVFLGIENILDDELAYLRATSKNLRRKDGKCHPRGDRAHPPQQDVHRRRADRRLAPGHARVCRGQPPLRARLYRLALHPAPDALPAHADDARLRASGFNRRSAGRGLRWHDRSGADGASYGRGGRVSALAGRALDEAAPSAGSPGI
jgi:anaerobic magnesium-protoporphyrin IX monomethyl ester cyclase